MKIIVVDNLSSALKLYDFNKNIKIALCLNLKHIILKRKREREREREKPWLGLLLRIKQNLRIVFR